MENIQTVIIMKSKIDQGLNRGQARVGANEREL